MADGTIVIEGRTYLSSGRASELFGYTKDYVGQLCRAGKLEAQLIGRSWYVAEDSIRKHKLSVHYTLTKPKKATKPKDSISEMTKQNIHSSDAVESRLVGTPPIALSIGEADDDREHDLIPKPVKKERSDALVHSDFRFHQEASNEYVDKLFPEKDQPDTKQDRKEESSENVVGTGNVQMHRKLSARKVPVRRRPLPSRDVLQNNVGIDGVRTSDGVAARTIVDTETQENRPRRSLEERMQTIHHGTRSEVTSPSMSPTLEQVEGDETISKTVPVIAAIVLFTIAVVVYLVVSSR